MKDDHYKITLRDSCSLGGITTNIIISLLFIKPIAIPALFALTSLSSITIIYFSDFIFQGSGTPPQIGL